MPSVRSLWIPQAAAVAGWQSRPITSKTFDVLVVLLEHRDHIVSKDELLNRVWPDTSVNENNLARQISSLRRALGQRPDQHDFVVTVPGRDIDSSPACGILPVCCRSRTRSATSMSMNHQILRWSARRSATGMRLCRGTSAIPGVSTNGPDSNTSSRHGRRRLSIRTLVAAISVPCDSRRRDAAAARSYNPQPRRTLQRITYDEAALPRRRRVGSRWSVGGLRERPRRQR